MKNGVQCLKIASGCFINSPRPPHLFTLVEKCTSKTGEGKERGGMIEINNVYPCIDLAYSLCCEAKTNPYVTLAKSHVRFPLVMSNYLIRDPRGRTTKGPKE